jgi:GT2 family glycosyltransferase
LAVVYSIIIVNYNGGSELVNCVDSVFNFTSDFELIVVDNGSRDNSISDIAQRYPDCTIIRNSKNVGFSNANNTAIKKAIGRWIILLNPDTRVSRNWLDNLMKCADRASEIGIVMPKLLRMDEKTLDSTGHVFDFRTGFTYDRGSGETDVGQYDLVEEVASCPFACVAIRTEVVLGIGLLDQRMVMYYEDVDYCIRARAAGWRVLYCPTSVVLHVRSGLTPNSSSRIQKWAVAYRLRIILKSYERRDMVKYGASRILRDIISALAGLKNNDPEYFLGYLRSPIWNVLNIPLVERRLVQSTRKVSDDTLFSE